MTPETRPLDSQLLRKLLLGELPSAEVESLAVEFASDGRLAEMAESLAAGDDTLRALLGNNETAVDSAAEPLVERLLQRLQLGKLTRTSDPTIALSSGIDATEAGFTREARVAPKLPERLEYFRPLRVLGQGGMGTVYLAEDTRLGREVAVKTLRAEFAANPLAKERFLREARTAARLEHDNVVPIYYVGEADGTPFLAMPLLKGESLETLLKRTKGPLPVGLAVRLAREIASGLAAAHAQGLIHRDIKPANIWLEMRGQQATLASEPGVSASEPGVSATGAFRAKVLDFGLAKAAGPESEGELNSPLTSCGVIVGTPGYMAPEQAGGGAVDARTDLFSLGCVLYQMLTGQVPFSGSNPLALIRSLAVDTPAAPDTLNLRVPAGLSQLVQRLLEREPAARPESATSVARALAEFENPGELWDRVLAKNQAVVDSVSVGRPEELSPRRQTALSRPRLSLLAALGLVALVGGGLLFGAQIIRIVTNQGQIVIETDGEGVEVVIKDGQGKVLDTVAKREITFRAGEYDIEVTVKDAGGEQRFVTDHFVLTRNGRKTIDARWEVAKARPKPNTVEPLRRTDGSPLPIFTNTLGMEFARIPKGKAWLGGGAGRLGDREVEFKEDFYLGVYEVTQEEWGKVMGRNPSAYARQGSLNEVVAEISDAELKRFPVESVSWSDAQGFVQKLNELASEPGWTYRLPAADEWEYACRGGPMLDRADSAFEYTLTRPTNQLNADQANIQDALKRPCKVGSYAANRLGLYDMHGNVWEWGSEGPNADRRWLHGGCYAIEARFSSAANRGHNDKVIRFEHHGLRVARVRISPTDTNRYTNSLGMEFALIPRGKAWLGGGGGKPGNKEVEFKDDFYLGVYEVTQEEWAKVMGSNTSHFSRSGAGKELVKDIPDSELKRFPVDGVSWDDCQAFLEKLNEQAKETGWTYRLPYEAEWEYACRGGPIDKSDSAFDFYFEKPTRQLTTTQANFDRALGRTCVVGMYPANRLGLFEMQGNVWEWCQDERGKWSNGEPTKAMRGGAWYDTRGVEASNHGQRPHSNRSGTNQGLRVARVRVAVERPPALAVAPFDEKQAKAHQAAWAKYLGRKVFEENSLGMKLTLLPPGKFKSGCADTAQDVGKDWAANPEEQPVHEVEITHANLLSSTEITQEQFEKVLGRNTSAFSPKGGKAKEVEGLDAGKLPMESITWHDAVEFCNKLSEREGLKPYYEIAFPVRGKDEGITIADVSVLGGTGYRLPTEAEWEYACRAGTETRFSFPFDYGTLPQYGWFGYASQRPHDVGTRKPNAFGLHDMHGNVFEWCGDWFANYSGDAVRDPSGPAAGTDRVARGGSYNYLVQYHRSSFRGFHVKPGSRHDNLGFRVARTVPMTGMAIDRTDPDRRAAEWVLSLGGSVQVIQNQKNRAISKADDLGVDPFQLYWLSVGQSRKMTDDGLANLVGCKHVTWLDLAGTRLTNAGLAHISGLESLRELGVARTNVTDDGLAHLKNLANLRLLNLDDCAVTGAGLVHVRGNKNLKVVCLAGTDLNDAAFDHLKEMTWLEELNLVNTRTDNADLARLSKLTKLWNLQLGFTKVSAGGLVHLKDCKNLAHLGLAGTKVTNADLAHIGQFKNLGWLELNDAVIDDEGLAHLKDLVKMEAMNLTGASISRASLLHLKDFKSLTGITISSPKIGDESIDIMANWSHMKHIRLHGTKVTDAGARKLAEKLPGCRVTWDGGEIIVNAPAADAARRAVEWVLSVGGSLTLKKDGVVVCLKQGDSLIPESPFEVLDLSLLDVQGVDDASIENLKDMPRVTGRLLLMNNPKLGDAGLAKLISYPTFAEISQLTLSGQHAVSESGFEQIKSFAKLTTLSLGGPGVTDATLENLVGRIPGLTHLELSGPLTRKGLEALRGLGLNILLLYECHAIDDDACEALARFPALKQLTLSFTPTSDAALERLAKCKTLRSLTMTGCNIRAASLKKTPMTDDGIRKLAAARPDLRIQWDDGLIDRQATSDPDRRAAEWVLSVGGNIGIVENGKQRDVKHATDLPKEGFQLTVVLLHDNAQVDDSGLSHFLGCKNVLVLSLARTKAGDAGLNYFKDCESLQVLTADHTLISDAGLARLRTLKHLWHLDLGATQVTDRSLALFNGSAGLKILSLGGTAVTNDGLAQLSSSKNLTELWLYDTKISDKGLEKIKELKSLGRLELRLSQVSKSGVEKLAADLPFCRIVWNEGVFEPKQAVNRKVTHVDAAGWKIEGDELVQTEAKRARLIFGDPDWTDYDLTLETKATPGKEGSQGGNLLFRVASLDDYLCLSLGGYGGVFNEIHYFKAGNWGRDLNLAKTKHETDRWYKVTVQVRGAHVRCTLDGETIFDFEDDKFPKGSIGLQTWNNNTPIRWRNIKVVSPDGKVLWDGLPELPGEGK